MNSNKGSDQENSETLTQTALIFEIESMLKQHWQKSYQAYLADGEDAGLENDLFGESAVLIDPEQYEQLPETVSSAAEFYDEACSDWGSATTYRYESETGSCWLVSVSTDGDDGWLEVFDAQGKPLAAARRYIELLAWGEIEAVRSYVESGAFPAELENRMSNTLWRNPEKQ